MKRRKERRGREVVGREVVGHLTVHRQGSGVSRIANADSILGPLNLQKIDEECSLKMNIFLNALIVNC